MYGYQGLVSELFITAPHATKKKKYIIISIKPVLVLPTQKSKQSLKARNKKDDHHRQFGGRVTRVLYKVHLRLRAFYFLNSKNTDFDYVLYDE